MAVFAFLPNQEEDKMAVFVFPPNQKEHKMAVFALPSNQKEDKMGVFTLPANPRPFFELKIHYQRFYKTKALRYWQKALKKW
jgi:hypothetical protein